MKFKTKSRRTTLTLLSSVLLLLTGCEQRGKTSDANYNQQETLVCDIQHTIEQLPNLLKCSRQWEARRIVVSNITENIRRIGDPLVRRCYVSSYTNAVLNLEFPIDAALDDEDASRLIDRNLSAYYELVECGFSMLCYLDSMTPGAWDFFLKASHKYKKALEMRAARLKAKGVPATKFRKDALFNDLRDGVQNCFYIIERGWYPSAKRRMSPSQLAEVRKMIKNIFGNLPPDIAKDELTNLPESSAIP